MLFGLLCWSQASLSAETFQQQLNAAEQLFSNDAKAGEAAFLALLQQQTEPEQRLKVQQLLCWALAPAQPAAAIALQQKLLAPSTAEVTPTSATMPELWQLRFQLCRGYAEEQRGENQQALDIYHEILKSELKQQDPELHIRALSLRAEQYARTGEYPKALADFQQALTIAAQHNDPNAESYLSNALANLYADPAVADYQDAIPLYQRTLAYHRSRNNLQDEATALFNLGSTFESMGDLPQALTYLQQALQVELQRQQPDDIAYNQRSIAIVLTKSGRAAEAVVLLDQAIAHYRSSNNLEFLAYCQLSRAVSYKALKQWQQAADDLAAAAQYFKANPNARFEARLYKEFADLQAQRGDWQSAFLLQQQQLRLDVQLQQQLLDQRTSALKTQLQTEQIRSDKELLQQKNLLQQQQLQDAEQLKLWQMIALGCAVLLILTLLVLMQRQRKLSRQLADLALLDELTRLPNRRHTVAMAEQLWQQSSGNRTNFTVLALDIDFFKKINDTFGHQAGDLVLKKVAYCLRFSLRPQDKIGRVGGEEFLILLPSTEQHQALEIARRLCQEVAALKWPELQENQQVTLSIGVASRQQQSDLLQLWHQADTALYQAKHQGRNQAVLFSS
ncbi:diguanylate cyclase [Rheinheimera riviphila]|nr:diguanylate cyclase [Rheinheimera riviphila]